MDELSGQPPAPVDSIDQTPPRAPGAGEDGSPVYDQQFFLALARSGKDIWNEWRVNHPFDNFDDHIKVTFESVDFREAENSKIAFAGFDCGPGANFSGATFGDRARFKGWSPDQRAKFRSGLAARLSHVWSEAQRTAFVDDEVTTAADPNSFQPVSFAGARFLGHVDCDRRTAPRPFSAQTQDHASPDSNGPCAASLPRNRGSCTTCHGPGSPDGGALLRDRAREHVGRAAASSTIHADKVCGLLLHLDHFSMAS
jgi:hypothetical protein